MLYPSRSARSKMNGFNGDFSGIGQRPQLTRICSRISFARSCHWSFVAISGKVRGVFRSITARFVAIAENNRFSDNGDKPRTKPRIRERPVRFIPRLEPDSASGGKREVHSAFPSNDTV